MYLDYLKERYNEADFNLIEAANDFESFYDLIHKTDSGFITYELKGDAVIIHDIWVKPECRGMTESLKLFNHVMKEAKTAGKRVAIGFSEFTGKNHLLGVKAMKSVNFVPAFKTNREFVFIKGI